MRIFTAILLTLLLTFEANATDPLRIPVDATPLKSAIINEEAPADIDLLIIYTAEAKQWASTRGGIDTLIARGMRLLNKTHKDSQTGVTFHLLKAHQTDYIETGNSLIDLRRLTFGYDLAFDGAYGADYMAYERALRDSLGADLVVLVPARASAAGLAWQLSTEAGRPVYGTSIVAVHYIDKSSFPHEIGHNMGAHHHYAQLSSPGPGLYPYSSGYSLTGSDGKGYVTVMSYTSGYPDGFRGTRIEIFSNPNILHLSEPVGHPELADNARTIRRTKHTVASYRQRPPPPPPPPPPLYIPVPPVTDDIIVYPNPTSSYFYITSNKVYRYRLMSIQGQLITEGRKAGITVLHPRQAGLYILTVQIDGKPTKLYRIIRL